MPTFHIVTLVTKPDEYERSKQSFIAAGFTEDRCRYTVLDNTKGNVHDPFRSLTLSLASTPETYLIFCHQDLTLDRGDDFDTLCARLAELEEIDPNWAVAGNAGLSPSHWEVMQVSDHNGHSFRGPHPGPVSSLDEDFLVLRPGTGLTASEGLSGFHLYATDIVQRARLRGLRSYGIDFHLFHAGGDLKDSDLTPSIRKFKKVWNKEFRFAYIRTTCTTFFLSRYAPLRWIFGMRWVERFMFAHPGIYRRAYKWLRQGERMPKLSPA